MPPPDPIKITVAPLTDEQRATRMSPTVTIEIPVPLAGDLVVLSPEILAALRRKHMDIGA